MPKKWDKDATKDERTISRHNKKQEKLEREQIERSLKDAREGRLTSLDTGRTVLVTTDSTVMVLEGPNKEVVHVAQKNPRIIINLELSLVEKFAREVLGMEYLSDLERDVLRTYHEKVNR